jgi:DNA-binding CsgD family transcriptional regulator
MATKHSLKRKSDVLNATRAPAPESACPESPYPEIACQESASRANPLGEIKPQEPHTLGFNAQDLLVTAAEGVPPWQRDNGQNVSPCQLASIERQDILKALTKMSRFGVILDANGQIVQGNTGWSQHLATIPVLSAHAGRLMPVSTQSQIELVAALKILFDDFNWTSVPVALRDLDGWVIDILHLKRVGNANPTRAYAVLPKSSIDLSATLATLDVALQLTPLETTFVRLIVNGQTDREMAAALGLKQSDIKRGIRDLIAKFRVRQKSDIVRIVASFP